jgi:hypothetical protein
MLEAGRTQYRRAAARTRPDPAASQSESMPGLPPEGRAESWARWRRRRGAAGCRECLPARRGPSAVSPMSARPEAPDERRERAHEVEHAPARRRRRVEQEGRGGREGGAPHPEAWRVPARDHDVAPEPSRSSARRIGQGRERRDPAELVHSARSRLLLTLVVEAARSLRRPGEGGARRSRRSRHRSSDPVRVVRYRLTPPRAVAETRTLSTYHPRRRCTHPPRARSAGGSSLSEAWRTW